MEGLRELLLMVEEILQTHQLIWLVVEIPLFNMVLYIPGGCLGFLNHQQYDFMKQLVSTRQEGVEIYPKGPKGCMGLEYLPTLIP